MQCQKGTHPGIQLSRGSVILVLLLSPRSVLDEVSGDSESATLRGAGTRVPGRRHDTPPLLFVAGRVYCTLARFNSI